MYFCSEGGVVDSSLSRGSRIPVGLRELCMPVSSHKNPFDPLQCPFGGIFFERHYAELLL